VFNFAQGEFGTVAVYVLWNLLGKKVPYLVSIPVALLAAIALGLALERLVIRPLFEAPRVILLVATAGVALLCIGVEIWWGGARPRVIDPLLRQPDRVSILGVHISDQQILLLAVLAAFAIGLAYFFNRTNLGLAILSASQEPTATELVGISVRRLSGFTWALAALLGGVVGVVALPAVGTFTPGALTVAGGGLIPGITAAVLGGMTSLPGAFVGGAIVGIAQSAAQSWSALRAVPAPDAVVVFVLLVAVLSVRPQGLLGKGA
jgi:branched-chain amino acid transport system permease protein